ncbi:MAG: hypothetical protein IJC38_02185, partial [Erysipelotrichaceae bacterium]|nr:hypothetical protein [Erysipelotrichaceae bacterium]
MMKKTNKNVDKREAHIKKKLSAAILMLLISCIMCVTSTYAWFTLSTAPEITGVSTTVGANGSLEIALVDTDLQNNSDNWTEGPGASTTADSGIYTTWGNLVHISSSEFGLDKLVLYPSELNVNESDASKIDAEEGILRTPEYGADGRVTTLKTNTSTGIYDGNGKFVVNELRGVKAIGTVSSMTDRQLYYRNARANIRANMTTTTNTIRTSWRTDGTALTMLAIRYVEEENAVKVSESEYASLNALVASLETSLNYVDAGLINAIDAHLASKASTYA